MFQQHHQDGSKSWYLSRDRDQIKEVRASAGKLGPRMQSHAPGKHPGAVAGKMVGVTRLEGGSRMEDGQGRVRRWPRGVDSRHRCVRTLGMNRLPDPELAAATPVHTSRWNAGLYFSFQKTKQYLVGESSWRSRPWATPSRNPSLSVRRCPPRGGDLRYEPGDLMAAGLPCHASPRHAM